MRALVFDFDGLMVDSEQLYAECLVEVIPRFGGRPSVEDFGHLFGSVDADEEWDRLLHQWCGRPVTMAEVEAVAGPIYRSRADALPLLPGVAELVDLAWHAGWKLGVGTGRRRERVEPALVRLGVRDRFGAVVTRQDVRHGKPAPDTFLLVAERLDVAPADCLVLEDSVSGCEAALAAGMRVVACPSRATAHCAFPAGVERVASLLDVRQQIAGVVAEADAESAVHDA